MTDTSQRDVTQKKNRRGRPRIAKDRRIFLGLSVAPKSRRRIEAWAGGASLGQCFDDLVQFADAQGFERTGT